MPRKKVSIGAKPSSTNAPSVDDWVATRGESEPTEETAAAEKAKTAKGKMKRLTIDVTEELHRAIKSRAVNEGVAMADMLREKLEEWFMQT